MENNNLQNLINALGGNGFSQSQKPAQPPIPLYPAEAYSGLQQQQQCSQNALLPLILSLFGQNNNADALGNILSGQSQDLSSILSLLSSLPKKKDEKKEEVVSKETLGPLPKNELL